MTVKRLGIKTCPKHDVEYMYPRKCPQCEEEKRREDNIKYPHVGMEARYQHVLTFMFIMIGSDTLPFAESQFFCGWTPMPESLTKYDPIMYAGKQMPTFASAGEDGVIQPVMFIDRKQAHAAMTLLLAWYSDIGKDVGVPKPAGLCIG